MWIILYIQYISYTDMIWELHSALAAWVKQYQMCHPQCPAQSSSVLNELLLKHSEGSPNTLTSDLHTSLTGQETAERVQCPLVITEHISALWSLYLSSLISISYLLAFHFVLLVYIIYSWVLICVIGYVAVFDHACGGDLRLFLHAVALGLSAMWCDSSSSQASCINTCKIVFVLKWQVRVIHS